MTLKNLRGISLDTVAPDKALVGKLLAAAQRNIADAQLKNLSAENRFDAAYKAGLQSAMVALHAKGYQSLSPSRSRSHPWCCRCQYCRRSHSTRRQSRPLS
jgi:hypothetical protein